VHTRPQTDEKIAQDQSRTDISTNFNKRYLGYERSEQPSIRNGNHHATHS